MVTTKRTMLRPVFARDGDAARGVLAAAPEWRGGSVRFPMVIDPDEVMAQGVAAQAAIVSLATPHQTAGFVQLVAWDARTASAALSVGLTRASWRRVWPVEGIVAFIGWSFRTFDLDRIRLSIGDQVMAVRHLRPDRWAIREVAGIGETCWRLDRDSWFESDAEKLVALVL